MSGSTYSYANSYGNLGTYGRDQFSVGVGKMRKGPGCIQRVFDFCAGGTADLDLVLQCVFRNSPNSVAAAKNKNPTIDPQVGLYTIIIANDLTFGYILVRNNLTGTSTSHIVSNNLYQVQSSDSGQYIYVTVQPTSQSITTPQTISYYKSSDYGQTFSGVSASNAFGAGTLGIQSLAVSGNGNTLLASVTQNNSNEAYSYLYTSYNGGSTWTQTNGTFNDNLYVQCCINKAGNIMLSSYVNYSAPNVGKNSFTSYIICSVNGSPFTLVASMNSEDVIKDKQADLYAIYFSSIQIQESATVITNGTRNNIYQGNVIIGIGQYNLSKNPAPGTISTTDGRSNFTFTPIPNGNTSYILNGQLNGSAQKFYLSLTDKNISNLSNSAITLNTIVMDAFQNVGIAINGFVYNNGTYSSIGGPNAYGVWDSSGVSYQALQPGLAYLYGPKKNSWNQIVLSYNGTDISNLYWLSATISKDGKQMALIGCSGPVTVFTPNTPFGSFYVCFSTNFGQSWTVQSPKNGQPVGIYIN